MDKLFRLLTAIFYLVIALIMVVVASIWPNSAIAVINIYGAAILGLIGIGKGAFAIIDHKNDGKGEDKE